MNKLETQINQDIKSAMLSKDSLKLGTLRMVKTAITNLSKEKLNAPLDDNDVLTVLRREVKKHQDSIESFEKAGRAELAQKEKEELSILEGYLPKALSKGEVDLIVAASIQEVGATSKKQMGAVMKIANQKADGQVDGKTLSSAVQKALDTPSIS